MFIINYIVLIFRRHHKFRKYSMPDETVWRKRSGAFLDVEGRKFSIQPDEASTLQEMDQDDLASKILSTFI